MNSYFDQLELEMIALESAIGAYEAENNITEEYLSDYSTVGVAGYATEGVSENDFGFGLFSDLSPATEASDGEGGGSGIGKGIKNILAAVGRFFKKIGDGVKAFFQSFKKKKAETKNATPNVSPAAQQAASNMRGAIKSAVTIIGNITKEDTQFMQRLCSDITAAIKDSGLASKTLTGDWDTDAGEKALDKKANKRNEKFSKMGEKFVEGMGGIDHADEADERIKHGLEILDKVKKTEKDLNDALDKVADVFAAELKKAKLTQESYSERGNSRRSETDYQRRERGASYDAEDEKKLNEFNDAATRRANVGAGTASSVINIPIQALTNQIRQVIFAGFDISEVSGLCDGVVNACDGLGDFCTKVMNKQLENQGDANAKRAYKLCRILSQSSTIYSKLSKAIQELTTGSIFTKDGTNYGSVSTKRNSGDKDEQDFINE